jgi:hypothetical protein
LDLEIALNGVSAKIQPCGLFSRAEDKVKLSDDEIEETFTRPEQSVQLLFTQVLPIFMSGLAYDGDRDVRLQSRSFARGNQSLIRNPNSIRL